MTKESNRKSLSKGAAWVGFSRLLINSMGLISTLILARILLPEDFGIVAVAESIFAIAASITELSLAHSLIQHKSPRAYHYHTAWTLNLLRAVALAAIMIALGFPFAWLYGDERLIGLFLALALATVVGGFENPMLAVFTRNLIFRQEFAIHVASKLAGFAVGIAIAYAFRSYWALVLGSLAAQVMRVIMSYAVRPFRPRFSFKGYRDLLSFSVWLTLSNGIQTANWRLDPVFLGLFVPAGPVGHYTVGNRLAFIPVKEGLGPLKALFFPAFSRMQDNIYRLRHAYLSGQGLVCLIAMPIGFGFAIVAEPLVQLAMGRAWLPAVPVIQILVILSVFQVCESSQSLAVALDRTREVFKLDVRVFIIRIPIIVIGLVVGHATEVGALLGVIIGRAISSLINIGLNFRLVKKLIQITVAEQLSVIIRPLLAAFLMSVVLLISINFFKMFTIFDFSISEIAIIVATGPIIYCLFLAILWLAAGLPAGAEREVWEFIRRAWTFLRQRGVS